MGAGLFDEAIIQVESMLALGPFPRFASSTVKNVESSWAMVVDRFSFEEAGGGSAWVWGRRGGVDCGS